MNTADEGVARPALTLTDVVCGAPVLVISVVATSSLALAHAHRHSVPAALAISAVVLAAVAFLAWRAPFTLGRDPRGLAAALACGAVAAVMFVPGSAYGVGDKDPGVYTAHAAQIARGGSYSFIDPALAHPTLPVVEDAESSRHPGIWVRDHDRGLIVPQFYHLWSSLLATSYDVRGTGGIAATTPLVAVAGVLALVGLLRRVAGVAAAVAGGLLISTNMLQVWQAKYPSTEAMAQALVLGALLFLVVAVQERWRPAAFLGGALVGVTFLNRADGWLLVMLTAAVLSAVWVSRRADHLVAWGAAGLGLLLPYALAQAYGPAHDYTVINHIPHLAPTLAALGCAAAGAVLLRRFARRPVDAVITRFSDAGAQRRIGIAVCALYAALLVIGYLRPQLFGRDFLHTPDRGRLRSYDELNLHRLTWFVTYPGVALAALGVAVVALRRWRTDAWAVVLPVLALAPLFLWHSEVSVRLMWWGRRYVPYVLPGLVILMAFAVGYALAFRWRRRAVLALPAVVAAAVVMAISLSQSLPLRGHDEWRGAQAVVNQLSALSGDGRGVYLWRNGPCCAHPSMLFASPVWLNGGELSVLLPDDPAEHADYIARYRDAFHDDPVLVVWAGGMPLPPDLRALNLKALQRLTGTLSVWEEAKDHRPDHAREVKYDMTVYLVP